MKDESWVKLVTAIVAIAGIVVPYVVKSPEAAACATAIIAFLPSLLGGEAAK